MTVRQSVYDNLTPRAMSIRRIHPAAELKLTQVSRNARLTWQAAQKHKFNVFVDNAPQVAWHRGRTLSAPEATNYSPYLPNIFMTLGWKSPISNRWLRGLARAQLIELRPAPAHDRDLPVQRAGLSATT